MPLPPDPGPDFDALLVYLRAVRNFDFSGYKRVGLARRVGKRMRAVSAASYPEYQAYLDAHPDEFAQLFDTILINVTGFFRDELLWEHLRTEVVPQLLSARGPADPIRVWCAGCATGQEAYTLAIVLAEVMGEAQFRDRVKLYATDLDDDALAIARQGIYHERDVTTLPPDLVERYFEHDGQRYIFRKDLRRLLIFGRNDLMQDAPISRIDLLTCRNTLMYFDAAMQARVLTRFQFALTEGGVLVLGRAETLLTHSNLFVPVDLKRRIFMKTPRYGPTPGGYSMPLGPGWRDRLAGGARAAGAALGRGLESELRDAAFDAGPVAQLAIDRTGRVLGINERARTLFQLGVADLGRPLQDLEVSYRPFELRSLIDQALSEGRPVTHGEVPWRAPGGELRWFDIRVAPLLAPIEFGGVAPAGAGVSATFSEVTRHKQLQQQVQEAQAELEGAYQELQSTNEELETTNEELHSTVEELETTNEELQSTNEELETMNEELQSTNEELQSINDELRQRSEELNLLNAFLESVFASMRAGVVVLDRDLCVLAWSSRAEDQWGLRAGEVVGTNFFQLDIGLPVNELAEAVRSGLSGVDGQELVLAATNRRGRAIQCRITVRGLHTQGEDRPHGLLVLTEELTGELSAANAGNDGLVAANAP